MSLDNLSQLDSFILLSKKVKQAFDFLFAYEFILIKESLPKSLDYRDGFIFNYQGPIQLDIEYYEMVLNISFKNKGACTTYLFLDKYLFDNRSGLQGNMFPRDKLEKKALEIAEDIHQNYKLILLGNESIWQKIRNIETDK
jgi:hypothetical protein